ncbi:MAG: ankyrin repeat domain-containing protein [Verrucomicrobia bacterium]|nr:ankyrin repeat domain-containing protein [Verrucomicrobiota bacterium]
MTQTFLSQIRRIAHVASVVSFVNLATAEMPPCMSSDDAADGGLRDTTLLAANNTPSGSIEEASHPLLAAVDNGDLESLRKLLNQGADFEVKNARAETPLMIAAKQGRADMVRMLIRMGSDVDVRNDHGSALTIAVEKGDLDVANLLLASEADVDARDSQRRTPLMTAAHLGNPEMATLLMEKGAEIEASDVNGWTALRYAAKDGRAGIADAILARTRNLKASRVRGALAEALAAKHDEVVKVFRAHGLELIAKKADAPKTPRLAKNEKPGSAPKGSAKAAANKQLSNTVALKKED